MKLVKKISIDDYFDLINTVDLVIAVDGGGVHMACVYETPLLAFYANYQVNIDR
ncbi:glycosyltransferase family 9 protein [Vespertiliibacter pulmonis]|uniref:glycosyltransferase family 9 protein n=1 Tax=Vespertiliibacter pulmonis TaxID=1443036 RepID=UPI000F53DF75|nr:glycosyltransferase family 9 protein [Vespertiliibacter pulmonis]